MNAAIPYTAGRQDTPCSPAYTNMPAAGCNKKSSPLNRLFVSGQGGDKLIVKQ